MSRPDANDASERFATSQLVPRDEEGPVFAEPWQAQAFAIAVQLSAEGHFTWTEWTTALGQQLRTAKTGGDPDDGSRYFDHWIAALEYLVANKKLTDSTALGKRKEAWADAYRHTPHGQPVELEAKFR